MFETKDELGAADPAATIQRWAQEPRSETVLSIYLARMLVEDPDSSGSLLEHLVSQTEQMIADGVAAGSIRAHSNPRMLAVLSTLQGLAPLVMQRALSAILDGAPDLEAATRQIAVSAAGAVYPRPVHRLTPAGCRPRFSRLLRG